MIKPNFDNSRRVVITGLGVVSSLGIGWKDFWKNILAGKSGISKVTAFDTSEYDRHYAGEVKNFDPVAFIARRKIANMGRASQMAIAASKLALEDAKVKIDEIKNKRGGVFIGTTVGEIRSLEKYNDLYKKEQLENFKKVNFLKISSNSINSNIGIEFCLKGHSNLFSTACASGNYAIARAADLIKMKKIDFAIAGGSEGFSRIVFTGFNRLFAMSPDICSPFDKNRKGMLIGEGSGIILLESLESAEKRKASIYAEVYGHGLACDAFHMTSPSIKGVSSVLEKAINDAKINVADIDYISAHGTGTKENDKAECKAITSVLGKRIKDVPVSSIKSMLGHTMGAAAAIETVACCLAIKEGKIPPTINYKDKDPECNIDCVPNKGRKHKVNVLLNNSQAFGGNNACVVLKKA